MTISLVDTHAHLDDDRFQTDLAEVLSRAKSVGIECIVAIGTTAASSLATQQLADRYPQIRAAVGIQPNHVAEAAAEDWDQVVHLVQHPNVVAIGETGLDRHWDFSPFALQEDYFARHLDLAHRQGLPLVIHCRKAEEDVVRMLKEQWNRQGPLKGVMHSFTGDWPTAEACLACGLFISFAGMVTYKNADMLRAVAEKIPLERLLVETDSPYLVPVPLRGKVQRNEPAHIVHTAECLARIKGISTRVLAEQTAKNARMLFTLPG